MCSFLTNIFFSEALAAWVAAVASFAAVFWGVWQVRADARDKKRQRYEYTHEIASSSENVVILWDKLTSLIDTDDGSPETATLMGAHRLDLQMFADALELLLKRPDLSDGAIKCGVRARYLAIEIIVALDHPNGNGDPSLGFQTAAFDLLCDTRRIRKWYRLRPRKNKHLFVNLDENEIEKELEGVGRRA